MEQSIEFGVRRVARDKYGLVLLRDGEVVVRHGLAQYVVLDLLRLHFIKVMNELSVGGSVNFQSKVKFM